MYTETYTLTSVSKPSQKWLSLMLSSFLVASSVTVSPTANASGPDILLIPGIPDPVQYGYRWGTSEHKGGLVALFEGTGADLEFSYFGYDIDSNTEVKLFLNGEQIGSMGAGPDNGISDGDVIVLPAAQQGTGQNELRFVTRKLNSKWGVTGMLLSELGPDQPPEFEDQTISYPENRNPGAVLGTLTAWDDVEITGFSFQDSGGSVSLDGYYNVDSGGSVSLTAVGANALTQNDFESPPNSFNYTIVASDATGESIATLTLELTDIDESVVNQPPTFTAQSINYSENQLPGATLGTLAASDDVAITGFIFDASGTSTSADGYFEVDVLGTLSITDSGSTSAAENDFETPPNSFDYAISATDGTYSTSATITLNVVDVYEFVSPPPPPPVGGSVIDDALAEMAPNTWRKINTNRFEDVWTPPELRPTTASPSQNISGWSGGTWDPSRDQFYIWGGNIGMEEGNEVYIFNAVTGLWERGGLPSAVPLEFGVTERPYVIGGAFDAPLSGESWDNVVYVENLDRMVVMGISRNSASWEDLDGTLTGPYFWDPAKADPNLVNGSIGTGVDPNTPGGNMWENRDNAVTRRNSHSSAVYLNEAGIDVVLYSDRRGNLWRYTINPVSAALDSWEQLASRPTSGKNPRGGTAYDPVRKILVRPGHQPNILMYWDLNRVNEGIFKGETVVLNPALSMDLKLGDFGLDYDPVNDSLVLWGGERAVYHIDFEDLIDEEVTGSTTVRGYFTPHMIVPSGMDTAYDTTLQKFTGVYGKWHYMQDKDAFIGVIDPISGDVYLYKSGPTPEGPPDDGDSPPDDGGDTPDGDGTPPDDGGDPPDGGDPTPEVGPNDLTLNLSELDVGQYGYRFGTSLHAGGLVARFESIGTPLVFTVAGYDIDSNTEVKVYLNDQQIGTLSQGLDNGLNAGDSFEFGIDLQIPGTNELRFVARKLNSKWGITNLLLTPI